MIPLKPPVFISYSIAVAKNIDFAAEEFKNIVQYILQHNKGWKSYGYDFEYCENSKESKTLKNSKNETPKKHVHITLCNPEDVKKACGTSTLSCYDPSTDKIYINYRNWNGGSKSDLSTADYRIYVINHEMGHALGFEHTKCPALVDAAKYCSLASNLGTNSASIMQQMSKGPEHIAPCKSNMWPLPHPAEFELQKTATTGLFMGGGLDISANDFSSAVITVPGTILVALLVIILVIILIINFSVYFVIPGALSLASFYFGKKQNASITN